MAEFILNWVADQFANSDIIDLYFILSDLVDLSLSEVEVFESDQCDALAIQVTEGSQRSELGSIPLGKMVL